MPVQRMHFEEAIDRTKHLARDLLLGNGFSIAAYDGFAYDRLLERASVPDEVRAIFTAANTPNFEAVMRILLAESTGMDSRHASEARSKIDALKDALVQSIHEVHPPRRNLITGTQWARCEDFLEHFIGTKRKGRIFTTNYDLLLSWAVAPDRDLPRKHRRLRAYEGFGGTTYDSCAAATIIYLHGALHLYEKDGVSRQFQYRNSGVPLHEQVRILMEAGGSPIIVTEGASSLKEPKPPGFLYDAYDAFQGTCRGGSNKALFILGHGLGPEDGHLLKWIPFSSIQTVCLGAFGRPQADHFTQIAEGWVAARAKAHKASLSVYIFNSREKVWGPRPT